MATTRESIDDAVRWVLEIFAIGVRRAFIVGVFVGLFAVAVVLTTRETVSDCSDVTDQQRAVLTSLASPTLQRSFRAFEPARCSDGEYTAPVTGVAGAMDAATSQLTSEGWILETNFVGFYTQLWRRCFRLGQDGWERVQITVDASRGGVVHSVRATAPENADACTLERRETSEIFPP